MPSAVAFDKARHFAELALKLDPTVAGPHALLGNIDGVYDWDWPAAEREIKLALAGAPNDTCVLNVAAQVSLAVGRWDDALKLLNRSQELGAHWTQPATYY